MIAGSATQCPTCSRPLPTGAPAGLCPACLLAQGAETESGAVGPRTRFEPPPLAEIAALFPQLEVLRLLGTGGMGAVYQAQQPALGRFVALKVLPVDADGGATFTERFNREARALARLNHPNIVTVHEFGQADGWNYFLMEFVDGPNLRQLEQTGRLSPRQALQIIPQICDALQYAHDEGVVHRDIKPENVLVDRKGRVKIADFGLAKILGLDPEAARLTVEGEVMGTPHYMAPEQMKRPLAVDHRADIYALGVVFYEMLTGDLPLGKFAPPSRKVQVDVRFDEIVLRALENDPERRYQQASEVKQRVATVVGTPAEAKAGGGAADESDEDALKPGVRYLNWLGIPVVTERDGEREVNFQGALKAVFVTMIVATLAHQIVRWLDGTEQALAWRVWLAGGLTVIWGIRRTLNQPWDNKQPRPANGTVVLAPRHGFPYWRDALMLVGLFAFTLGSHYLKPWLVDSGVKPALKAKLDPRTHTLYGDVSNGRRVSLLALRAANSEAWMRPDNTPAADFDGAINYGAELAASPGRRFDLVFRITGLEHPDAGEEYEFPQALRSQVGGYFYFRGGDGTPAATPVQVVWPDSVEAVSFRVGLAMGEWQTIQSYDPLGGKVVSLDPKNRSPRDLKIHTAAVGAKGLQLTIVYGTNYPGWNLRAVAAASKPFSFEFIGEHDSSVTNGSVVTATYVFTGLSGLDQVNEFRAQACPLEWVEFEGVRLPPANISR